MREDRSGVVKICGLTTPEDARAAAAAGADLVGFVFFPGSRRRLGEGEAAWIRELPDTPPRVGVFRDQDPAWVEEMVGRAKLSWVQLHGAEAPEVCAALGRCSRVIKAVSVNGPLDWGRLAAWAEVAQILFDTASPTGGGSGRPFDWSLVARRSCQFPVWLAGGLEPDNVASAIALVRPQGVDVASGVEIAVGRKDPARMRAFVAAARAAWRVVDVPPGEGEG